LHPAPAPSLRNARCSFSIRRNQLLLRLPLPFRTFTSLRIKVPPVPPPVRPASRICPISSRSPQPLSITRASATDHRSWSATFPHKRLARDSIFLAQFRLRKYSKIAGMPVMGYSDPAGN
jgi:hypothetical protein